MTDRFVSRGFVSRARDPGDSAGRLPPGQYLTDGFPVLSAGPTPQVPLDFMDRGARDEALQKASEELMPNFTQCPRDQRWVDTTCWNEARGLCIADAPKLAAEMEAERAQVEVSQMRQAMQGEQVFSGDLSARATICVSCGKPVGSEKFCSNCGTPTGQDKCANCGNDLAAGAKFCANCGTAVMASA